MRKISTIILTGAGIAALSLTAVGISSAESANPAAAAMNGVVTSTTTTHTHPLLSAAEEQHPSPRHTGRSPLLCARPNGRRQRYLVHARRRAGIRSPRSDPARLRSCAGLPFLTGPHRCEMVE